jgi:Zn-finger nucleic acid-binding protein
MTLLDRIRFQQSIHPKINEVWLPADEVEALIQLKDKADAYMLKAQAHDRLMRQQAKRRQSDRLAKAIANPKPRV